MPKFQVNYEQHYISGALKGKVYHSYQIFSTRADAELFAARDGLCCYSILGGGEYFHRDSIIIDLSEFA